jgi:hypothetical protein
MECLIDLAFTHQDWLSIVVTITIECKLLGLLHNNSNEFNDNLMCAFSHLLANGIRLVFTQSVLHLQDIKKFLHILKICQRTTKFQELKDGHKLNELTLLFTSFTRISHHFNNSILAPTSPHLFILGTLTISRHKILPHCKSKTCNLTLPPTCMLLQTIKLRN